MKKRFHRLLHLISTVTTGTLAVYMFWDIITLSLAGKNILMSQIPSLALPEILSVGILCGVATELLLPNRELPVTEGRIRCIIHYALINAIVLICGYLYGWYALDAASILLMCLTSAGVYVFTFLLNFHKDKKMSDEMNEKLEKYKSHRGI